MDLTNLHLLDKEEHFRAHKNREIRPDGRTLTDIRGLGVKIEVLSSKTACGSSMASIGNTKFFCAIILAVGIPSQQAASMGDIGIAAMPSKVLW